MPDESQLPESGRRRRRYPRLKNPRVSGRLTIRRQARLVDISGEGIGLEADKPLQPSHRFRLTLHDGVQTVRVLATGVWNRLSETRQAPDGDVRPIFRGGLVFDRSPTPDTTTDLGLLRFIAANALGAVPPGHPGRAKRYRLLPAVDRVELGELLDFRVKTLSAGGMLVELDLLSEVEDPLEIALDLPWVKLELRGRLVSRECLTGNHTRLAVEFENLGERQRRQIQGLVAEGLGTAGLAEAEDYAARIVSA